MAEELAIEYRSVESLIPYAKNARTHSPDQVAQIAASVKEFGWTNPILVDGDNGIIAGHGRVMAARKLGMDSVPCIELAGMSDTQKRAYIIADNKLALNAGWDDEMLRLEIGELKDEDFDLSLLGFDDEDLAALDGAVDALDGMPDMPDGGKEPFQQMTFTLHDEQVEQVLLAIASAKAMGPFDGSPNENGNGNALARVCELFVTKFGAPRE